MKKAVIIFVSLLIGAIGYAQSLVEMADSAYNKGDYKKAEELYLNAKEMNGVSSQLYYNLANTYYRLGKLGKAVINYERALQLNPSMSEAQENLAFVNTKILDKPEDDSSFLGNLHRSITSIMSPNAWAWIAFGLFALILGSVALYVFTGNVLLRKTGFFGAFVILILFIYVLTIAAQTASAPYSHARAAIIVPTSNLTTIPGASNSGNAKIIPVHEGTVVEIVDSMAIPGDSSAPLWYDVKINNSARAWVKASDIEKI